MSTDITAPVPSDSPDDPQPPQTPPENTSFRLGQFLYTHNPFYFISAGLVLYAIRAAYGDVQIGELNCWGVLLVLSGYTALMAGTGIFIVKIGSVWQDARSILLILLLLFLAISVSTDELLILNPDAAIWLIAYGYLFSVITAEVIIRSLKLRLPSLFRIPFHLQLLLIDVYPYFCSPEVWDLEASQVSWRIFAFPQIFAVLILLLWPAVRKGADYVRDNGTPWNWPAFPWILFGVLTSAAVFRSWILSVSFGASSISDWSVNFGSYFLIPMFFVVQLLLLEMGLVGNISKLLSFVMRTLPAGLLLALPSGNSADFENFLRQVTHNIGAPIWFATLGLVALYGLATIRRVPESFVGLCASLALLSILSPRTISSNTMTDVQPLPVFAIAALCLIRSAITRQSLPALVGWSIATIGVGLILDDYEQARFRFTICYHFLLVGIIACSLMFHDGSAKVMKKIAALQLALGPVVVTLAQQYYRLPALWVVSYTISMAVIALIIGWLARSKIFLISGCVNIFYLFFGTVWFGYTSSIVRFGRGVMISAFWGAASFGIGLLISLSKAGKLGNFEDRAKQWKQSLWSDFQKQ